MPQPLFDVFFRGALVADADPGEVRDRLAALFGLGPGELDRLFAGATVCVKRAVDVETASQLRGRFRDAGALVDIRPAETAAKAPPPVPAALAAASRHREPAASPIAPGRRPPPRCPTSADSTSRRPARTSRTRPPRRLPRSTPRT
jgi:hypothetical protein